jgi:murein DD-endopeptidase MepM/ murein hydrolase activator NlpD
MVQRALNKAPSHTTIATNGIYDETTKRRVGAFRAARSLRIGRDVDQQLLDELWPYFDAYGRWRYRLFRPPAPPPLMVAPIARGSRPTFLHPTAGLLGNWALDWMSPGGTPVVAVEPAKIKKLSGRDPRQGADQAIGIFGYSIHYETSAGYRYFSTHYGERERLYVGQVVQAGQKIGEIGNWPGDPGRSHLHLGVTSPLGVTDAKRRIQAVASSPPPA